jgi:signal transduction histidine kinase
MTGNVASDGATGPAGIDRLEPSHVELERNREALRLLAGKLLTVQDEERRRISRDVHDDVNQRLGVLGLELDSLCRDLPATPAALRRQLRKLRRQVTGLSDDVRQLAYRFHQTTVEDLGLVVAMQRYIGDFVRRTGIRTRFVAPQATDPIPQPLATCLYRVVQESLGNVAVHAQASQVLVELTVSPLEIGLKVQDDGIGMNLEEVRQTTRGLGILSMRERASFLNGVLDVISPSPDRERTSWLAFLYLLANHETGPDLTRGRPHIVRGGSA